MTRLDKVKTHRLAKAMPCSADKSERLKQAKREAEKEIQSYKQQREDAYQKRIKDVRGVSALQTVSKLFAHCMMSLMANITT